MAKSDQKNINKPEAKSADGSPKRKPKPRTASPHKNVTESPAHHKKPATETIAATNPETNTSETMEVHHHPQLEHKPKPWKEYLIEGFMIFIAVMMGFIAENIREDITNREHVRQLTSQLAHELRDDIRGLDEINQFENKIYRNDDSLFRLAQQPLAKADLKQLQKLVEGAHSMAPFHPSGGAIGAIKNELHLKQFSDSEIISYITSYERHIELLRTVQDITLKYQRSLLDPFLLAHFTPKNMDAAFNQSPIPDGQMRNLTQENLTQLGVDMVLVKINTKELITDNERLKNDATKLLNYVTKQYDLK